jgi:hypothetical protein
MRKLLTFLIALAMTAIISASAFADGVAVPGIPQIGQVGSAVSYPPSSGGGSVSLDACSTDSSLTTGNTTFSTTLNTVGSLSQGAEVVVLHFQQIGVTGTTATLNGSGMTLITSATSAGVSGHVEIWGQLSPSAGPAALVLNWTTTSQVKVAGCSWSGVNTTFGTAFANHNTATGNSTATTVNVSSAVNHQVMAVMSPGDGSTSISSITQTSIFLDNGGAVSGAANRAAGSATVTMAGTMSGATQWVVAGTDISP